LAWFWDSLNGLFKGPSYLRALEFGLVYPIVAIIPVTWNAFSSLDITILIVLSCFFYGLAQAIIVGIVFSKINA
jgi:hypothetical protein